MAEKLKYLVKKFNQFLKSFHGLQSIAAWFAFFFFGHVISSLTFLVLFICPLICYPAMSPYLMWDPYVVIKGKSEKRWNNKNDFSSFVFFSFLDKC